MFSASTVAWRMFRSIIQWVLITSWWWHHPLDKSVYSRSAEWVNKLAACKWCY